MRAKEITGKLETITDEPSTVRAVYLRPPSTRVSTTGLIVDELVRIPVDDNGNFVKKIAYGAGILVLVGEGGLHREAIPILVHEGTETIRQAVEDAKDFTPELKDRLAEIAAATTIAAAQIAEDRKLAEDSATRAENAAATAAASATEAVARNLQEIADRVDAASKKTKEDANTATSAVTAAQDAQRQASSAAESAESSAKAAQEAARAVKDLPSTAEWVGDRLVVGGVQSPPLTGPAGAPGPEGKPGTVSFDELTEEQRAQLMPKNPNLIVDDATARTKKEYRNYGTRKGLVDVPDHPPAVDSQPGKGAVAIASGAEVDGIGAVAIGYKAKSTGDQAVTVGENASAAGHASVAVGGASVAAEQAVSVGERARAGELSTAIGPGTGAQGNSCVAVGAYAGAQGDRSLAVGHTAFASGTRATAIGEGVSAEGDDLIVIGTGKDTVKISGSLEAKVITSLLAEIEALKSRVMKLESA